VPSWLPVPAASVRPSGARDSVNVIAKPAKGGERFSRARLPAGDCPPLAGDREEALAIGREGYGADFLFVSRDMMDGLSGIADHRCRQWR